MAGTLTGIVADVAARLREVLAAANYTEEGLPSVLGPEPRLGVRANREVYLRRLGDDRAATLARLLHLGAPVPEESARQALSPLEPSDLAGAGLVELRSGSVRPLVGIVPFEGMLFAADLDEAWGEAGFVSAVSPSARTLAVLTIRRQAGSTLDLGTGSGVHGLLAARHSGKVVGVDVNRRALDFSELNARLNGIENFETRLGSWFEPVADEQYDLVVANPPYVVSPETELLYRDSGLPGDEISRRVLAGIPAHLREGGFAHVLCNWLHPPGSDWREPLEAALTGSGCDAVLLHYETVDPAGYAGSWNAPLAERDFPAFRTALDRWLGHYREAGIEAFSWGMVALRRRSGARNWVRAFEAPGFPSRGAGDHVERLFTGKDYLRGLAQDEALLDEVFSLVDGTRFEHRFRPESDEGTRVFVPANIGFAGRIDARAAEVLVRCDGRQRLDEVVSAAAGDLRINIGELRAAAVEGAKRLLELGFLDPPAGAGEE